MAFWIVVDMLALGVVAVFVTALLLLVHTIPDHWDSDWWDDK